MANLVLNDLVEGCQAEGAEPKTPGALSKGGRYDGVLATSLTQPACRQDRYRLRLEPAQGELERARRRDVEPLDIVDGKQ
jgi:hypothetical protein